MNKNFILAEEFLMQSEKVQEELIKQWKPSIGDLFAWISDKDIQDCREVQCCLSENTVENSCRWKGTKEGQRIPLLQMHQLIDFIEDKTKCKVGIEYDTALESLNDVHIYLVNQYAEIEYFDYLFINKKDLLKALWKVTIKIAKESV